MIAACRSFLARVGRSQAVRPRQARGAYPSCSGFSGEACMGAASLARVRRNGGALLSESFVLRGFALTRGEGTVSADRGLLQNQPHLVTGSNSSSLLASATRVLCKSWRRPILFDETFDFVRGIHQRVR